MGHKVLQDHAFTICQMFMGWRMADDLATFAVLPEGTLNVDVLTGTCIHDDVGHIDTYISREISAWFHHRLEVHQIPLTNVLEARLTVGLKRILQVSKRRRGVTFDWTCDSVVKTCDREYKAQVAESHTWIPER